MDWFSESVLCVRKELSLYAGPMLHNFRQVALGLSTGDTFAIIWENLGSWTIQTQNQESKWA